MTTCRSARFGAAIRWSSFLRHAAACLLAICATVVGGRLPKNAEPARGCARARAGKLVVRASRQPPFTPALGRTQAHRAINPHQGGSPDEIPTPSPPSRCNSRLPRVRTACGAQGASAAVLFVSLSRSWPQALAKGVLGWRYRSAREPPKKSKRIQWSAGGKIGIEPPHNRAAQHYRG